MMEKRPNVFPSGSQEPKQQRNEIRTDRLADTPVHSVSTDSDYDKRKLEVADEVYSNSSEAVMATGSPMADAIEAMRKRTEEQIKLRNERLAEMQNQTQQYQQQYEAAKQREQPNVKPQPKVLKPEPKIIKETNNVKMSDVNSYIQQLSQPQFNTAFDLIPIPSEGKLYKNKKKNFKVGYLTTADENILTSPNLLESGEFLEILINRKLLEPNIRYKDLHVGDRNAIMIWLRATGYGEMYPVTLFDENEMPFETEINLNELKFKNLGAEPDEEGYFDFTFPICKKNLKFKLLTVGDLEEIETMVDEDKRNDSPVLNTVTYMLQKQIIEIDGLRDINYIQDFIQTMRVGDSKALREYINKIESGVDLNINVRTPGGESIKTFLPLNFNFFWPNFSL